jgi:hypothetical protein
MQYHHFKRSSSESLLEKSSFIIFNMFLHLKFIYNLKNYEYDSPNSLPKCAFTFNTFGFMCLQHIFGLACSHDFWPIA